MEILRQVFKEVYGQQQNIQLTLSSSKGGHSHKKKGDSQLKQKAISHPLVADAIEIFDGKLIDIKVK
jgi:hypothetical protein